MVSLGEEDMSDAVGLSIMGPSASIGGRTNESGASRGGDGIGEDMDRLERDEPKREASFPLIDDVRSLIEGGPEGGREAPRDSLPYSPSLKDWSVVRCGVVSALLFGGLNMSLREAVDIMPFFPARCNGCKVLDKGGSIVLVGD